MLQHKGTQLLETPRLMLRKFTMDDAQVMYENWASDPEVTKFLTWPPHNSVEVTKTTFSVRAACPEGGTQGAGKILQAPVGEAGARQLRAGMTEGN